jgi:hypothetical protein
MRRLVGMGSALLALSAAGALAAGVLAAPATLRGAPPGAAAICADATYSFSQTRSGTCSHHGGVARWLTPAAPPPTATTAKAPAPTTTTGRPSLALGATVLLGRRTATSGCKLGPNPDRRCSPGAYSAGLTKDVICSPGFRTSTIRNVPAAEKRAVKVAYGMQPRGYGSALEIDHIISLELGGSNSIANLFPEQAPGYHAKDKLENRLHQLVCSGEITLRGAQQGIAQHWQALYARIFRGPPAVRR